MQIGSSGYCLGVPKDNIAWETEVWLADVPEHMIHFNGDRFMGPR